jgi:hypothetical protein
VGWGVIFCIDKALIPKRKRSILKLSALTIEQLLPPAKCTIDGNEVFILGLKKWPEAVFLVVCDPSMNEL